MGDNSTTCLVDRSSNSSLCHRGTVSAIQTKNYIAASMTSTIHVAPVSKNSGLSFTRRKKRRVTNVSYIGKYFYCKILGRRLLTSEW